MNDFVYECAKSILSNDSLAKLKETDEEIAKVFIAAENIVARHEGVLNLK